MIESLRIEFPTASNQFELSELILFSFVISKVVVLFLPVFNHVLLIEFVLFAMDSLLVLFQIPLPAKFFVAQFALNLFLHSTL